MFTGIIEAVGRVASIERKGADARLVIDAGRLDLADVKVGDSIAVSGVCLTVVSRSGSALSFDVSSETLARTTLADFRSGMPVNLEKALLPTTRLGGHLVSGHVDGVATVTTREAHGESVRFTIEAPKELARYIAEKGSICIEGVSLTVNAVDNATFSINIVPLTQNATTLRSWRTGTHVNLEVDLLARYLERLLSAEGGKTSNGVSMDLLVQYGFTK